MCIETHVIMENQLTNESGRMIRSQGHFEKLLTDLIKPGLDKVTIAQCKVMLVLNGGYI